MTQIDWTERTDIKNKDSSVGRTLFSRNVVETSAFGQRAMDFGNVVLSGTVDLFFVTKGVKGEGKSELGVRLGLSEAKQLVATLCSAIVEAEKAVE